MTILPSLYGSFLGFAAIFICIGFGMLFLRNAASGEVGPGYWSTSFFLNSAGFLFWAGTVTYSPWLFFTAGEILHMLGFITLAYGAYRFTGKGIQHWNIYALCGFAVAWLGTMIWMPQHRSGAFSLLMVFRAVIFLWTGSMILRHIPTKSIAGRRLAGGGLTGLGDIYTFISLYLAIAVAASHGVWFPGGFSCIGGFGHGGSGGGSYADTGRVE